MLTVTNVIGIILLVHTISFIFTVSYFNMCVKDLREYQHALYFDLFNPRWLYKKTPLNLFGVVLVTLFIYGTMSALGIGLQLWRFLVFITTVKGGVKK